MLHYTTYPALDTCIQQPATLCYSRKSLYTQARTHQASQAKEVIQPPAPRLSIVPHFIPFHLEQEEKHQKRNMLKEGIKESKKIWVRDV